MKDILIQILDKADDGQEDCETVYLTISAGEVRYLSSLLERSDKSLRAALLETLIGLKAAVPSSLPDSRVGNWDGGQSDYLLRMIDKAISEVDKWPVDKIGRWIGFVQGVLFENGALDIRAERARTRPLFHAAYREMGIEVPESWEGR